MKRTYSMYILCNDWNTVNYVGVTNDLVRRTWEHSSYENKQSFTAKYNVTKLVYYEDYEYIQDAIDREKQIKKWSRRKKYDLIRSLNPSFLDLSKQWVE